MKVPFLDLQEIHASISQDLENAVLRTLRSGTYIGGTEVEQFEVEFGDFVGAPQCVSVGNGLDALRLALIATGVCPGDEVIVPSHTFIATWLAVTQCGAVPVPIDPEPGTYCIGAKNLEGAITEKTSAVVPVHMYGHPADLQPILTVARRHNLRVVEDAAQAHGATYHGTRIGCHGDAIAWSFYPGKNLGAMGDGGAVTTCNEEVAEMLRLLRNYGSRQKYIHDVKGFNSRLDPVQAAILRVKLGHLEAWNGVRNGIAEQYLDALQPGPLSLPAVAKSTRPAWHLFVVRHRRRDELAEHLAREGIATQIHYPIANHRQKAYSSDFLSNAFPVAQSYAEEVLSLPIGPHMRQEHISHVISSVQGWMNAVSN